MDRVHRGLCPRVSAFAGSRANPDTPGVTYKMVKDYKVIMKIKKFRKKLRPFRGPSQKKGGGRPGLYTFSRLSGIREHTRLARGARVFADADKLFMVTLSGGLLPFFFAAGAKAKVGALLSEQVKVLGRITPTVRACLFGYIEASIFAKLLGLRGAEHALGRALSARRSPRG